MGCYFLLSLRHDSGLAFEPQPAHRYSPYEPPWTQLVFPRLGLPTAPPTSLTLLFTRLAGTMAGGFDSPWVAAIAAVAQVVALGLFSILLLQLRMRPFIVAATAVSLGMWPSFFGWATRWTPYLMLPSLVLGALVARHNWIATRRARWACLLAGATVCAVAESVYAVPVLLPLLLMPPASNRAAGDVLRARIMGAIVVAMIIVGLSLVLVGAAAAWREASAGDMGSSPSWWEAFVAVTTRWGRVVELYASPPAIGELRDRLRDGMGGGLLQGILALVGMFAFFRAERTQAWVLFAMLVMAVGVHGWLASPVSAVSPTAVVSVVLVFVFVAYGLAHIASAVRRPVLTLLLLGTSLAVHGVAAQRLSRLVGAPEEIQTSAVMGAVAGQPAVAVASDVERDRHLEHFMAGLPKATRINRIPQIPAAIRRAMSRPPVLVWSQDFARVSALGWMLAPLDLSNKASGVDVEVFEVVDALPCVQTPARTWVDITAPALTGAVSLQTESGSSYEAEIEADGVAAVTMRVDDALSRVAPEVFDARPGRVRLRVERTRRSLPLVQFDRVPVGARVQIHTDDASQQVQVCGASVRGVALNFTRGSDALSLPLAADGAFSAGWHAAEGRRGESMWRWSSAATATVEVQLPGEPAAIEVSVDAAPAAADRRPQLTLEVNDRRLHSYPMRQGHHTYTWIVERGIARRGLNVFRLHGPETVSPRSLGINPDDRELGLSLTGFRVRRIGE